MALSRLEFRVQGVYHLVALKVTLSHRTTRSTLHSRAFAKGNSVVIDEHDSPPIDSTMYFCSGLELCSNLVPVEAVMYPRRG